MITSKLDDFLIAISFIMPSQKKILSIEGLRGILALSVCFGHFGLGTLLHTLGLQFNFHFAVDLFFIISGLVLAHSYYYAKDTIGTFLFTKKRLARLYPLHLLTLLVMLALNHHRALPNPTEPFMEQLFLLNNIGISKVFNGFNFPSWSISVEVFCGLGFLFITQLISSTRILTVLFIIIILTQCLIVPNALICGDYEATILGVMNAGLFRGITGISVGILVYYGLRVEWMKRLLSNSTIGYVSASFLCMYFIFEPKLSLCLSFYICAYLFIGACAYNRAFFKILSTPLMVWLGTISYSLYLLHIPLYTLIQTYLGQQYVQGYRGKLLLIPLLLLLSHVCYRFFEVPVRRYLNSLTFKSVKRELKV